MTGVTPEQHRARAEELARQAEVHFDVLDATGDIKALNVDHYRWFSAVVQLGQLHAMLGQAGTSGPTRFVPTRATLNPNDLDT